MLFSCQKCFIHEGQFDVLFPRRAVMHGPCFDGDSTAIFWVFFRRAALVHSLLNCCRNTDDLLFKCHFAARRGLWPQKAPFIMRQQYRVAFQHNHLCTKFFHLATLQSESYLIIANSYHSTLLRVLFHCLTITSTYHPVFFQLIIKSPFLSFINYFSCVLNNTNT